MFLDLTKRAPYRVVIRYRTLEQVVFLLSFVLLLTSRLAVHSIRFKVFLTRWTLTEMIIL